MMKRTVVRIDEELCDGCGICINSCHEGALQLIDGKARMISDLYCDGLGACIGSCPAGAIELEEREAESYDEIYLKEHNMEISLNVENGEQRCGGYEQSFACPGSKEMSFAPVNPAVSTSDVSSQLRQWPVQLHLLNPQAGYFNYADVVIAADCTAYAYGNFHNRFLRNHVLAIACPKLDSGKEIYMEKITAMIELSNINTLTVVIMEVPCCGGLLQLVKIASEQASRKIPIKEVVVGIQGNIIKENWI